MSLIDGVRKSDLERAVSSLGREILRDAHNLQWVKYPFHRVSASALRAVSRDNTLKRNLMRFIDVFPTLRTPQDILAHMQDYLGYHGSPFDKPIRIFCSTPISSVLSPFIKTLITKGIHIGANHFIAGESPDAALSKLLRLRRKGYSYTVDLLGEFTTSHTLGLHYCNRYLNLIDELHRTANKWRESEEIIPEHMGDRSPTSVSIKLSALAPYITPLMSLDAKKVLRARLVTLLNRIRDTGAIVYFDAEDSGTNHIIYDLFEDLFSNEFRTSIKLPGIVVQAYLKSAESTVERLVRLAKSRGSPISIRLVKGAYWDSEVINAEQNGWSPPVFIKKSQADRNYEKLSELLIQQSEWIYPAFGSHNVRSLANAIVLSEAYGLKRTQFELQALYGMGDVIAEQFRKRGFLVRFYVPVGNLVQGMGYLVRRLLENTANESFLRLSFLEESGETKLLSSPSGD